MKTTPSLWSRVLAALVCLALLWFAFVIYARGEALWALLVLVLGGLSLYVYVSARTLAWRYLFPGVAAMLVFVAFPLVYTIEIGFTNYSSNNLLTEPRARQYLLEQADVDEERKMAFEIHRADAGWVLLLTPAQANAQQLQTPVLDLAAGTQPSDKRVVALVAASQSVLNTAALPIRDVIALRDSLRWLTLTLPDGGQLSYAGLREFGPLLPQWNAAPNGALQEVATGTVYSPNHETGYFQASDGTRLQPGFQVNVGWTHYKRLFGDPDMRGPFVSIFIWTVVFAGLTVLFSTAIGMTLAVVLNWEALKYRTLYRTLLFLPYAVPGFISILVFKGLFNQNFGEINAILDAVFGIKPAWFADPTLAKTMILIVNTWLGYPYIMVLCTGLIKSIPSDLYEASAIAGAKPLTNFFRITAPLVIKPLTPLLISAFAFNFNNFVLISLLTDGRPDYLNTKLPAGTTDILVSYTYRIAFTDAGQNFGLAAAISTVIFFLVAILSMVNLKLTQSKDKT